jgi:hypothetical protein
LSKQVVGSGHLPIRNNLKKVQELSRNQVRGQRTTRLQNIEMISNCKRPEILSDITFFMLKTSIAQVVITSNTAKPRHSCGLAETGDATLATSSIVTSITAPSIILGRNLQLMTLRTPHTY